MKQFPSRLKYRKNHKISSSNFLLKEQKNFFPLKGNYTLRVIEPGKLNFKQMNLVEKVLDEI
jgi:hypothetical protein